MKSRWGWCSSVSRRAGNGVAALAKTSQRGAPRRRHLDMHYHFRGGIFSVVPIGGGGCRIDRRRPTRPITRHSNDIRSPYIMGEKGMSRRSSLRVYVTLVLRSLDAASLSRRERVRVRAAGRASAVGLPSPQPSPGGEGIGVETARPKRNAHPSTDAADRTCSGPSSQDRGGGGGGGSWAGDAV
jgi:hypothetical protein